MEISLWLGSRNVSWGCSMACDSKYKHTNPQIRQFSFPWKYSKIFICIKSKFLEVSELSTSKEIKLSDTSHIFRDSRMKNIKS